MASRCVVSVRNHFSRGLCPTETVSGSEPSMDQVGNVMLSDTAVLAADGMVVFRTNSVQPPNFVGSVKAAFGNSHLSLPVRGHMTQCSTSPYLGRTPCAPGETLQHDVCICCPPHTVGFVNTTCTLCPPWAHWGPLGPNWGPMLCVMEQPLLSHCLAEPSKLVLCALVNSDAYMPIYYIHIHIVGVQCSSLLVTM